MAAYWLSGAVAATALLASALVLFRGGAVPSEPPEDSAPLSESSIFTIDLGSGGRRGAIEPDAFAIPDGARAVRIVLSVPPMEVTNPGFDLIGTAGKRLVSDQPLGARDSMGRFRVVVPSSILATRGEYTLLVHDAQGKEARATHFSYQFTIM